MTADTADVHWNEEWANISEGSKWLSPESDVIRWSESLTPGARILDLGAGVGRHALWLAQQGFDVVALDAAAEGIEAIRNAGNVEALVGRMDALPFEDNSFDHVLSWNVIYHGDEAVLARTISEIHRILRKGGSYLGTMLSNRRLPSERAEYEGREISRNTWVFDAPGTDKIHPHYFCDARDLLDLFEGFEIQWLEDREHEKTGSWHWHLIMERL